MSEYVHRGAGRAEAPSGENWAAGSASGRSGSRITMWAGWVWFAGIIMIMMGAFGAIEGFVALFNDKFYVAGPDNVLVFDLTGWGWLHLIVGALVLLTGIALLAGAVWARPVTVVLVTLNAVAQLAFVGVYPLWSIIVIALCVVVIWAIVVHGDESLQGW